MNSILKSAAIALIAASATTTAALAQHECDKVVRVDRIISNRLSGGGSYTYELVVSNLIANMVRFQIEAGDFPKDSNIPAHKSVSISPRGNLHIPFGSGKSSLDNVKKEFFYDVRHSLPQGYVLITDCVQASAR